MVNDPSTVVQVIHSGSDQDATVVSYLKQLARECEQSANRLDFQHMTYRDEQKHHRSTLIHMEIDKHKKSNAFVLVLISRTLIKVMWTSQQKRTFLKTITTMKNCFHLWLDVNEEIVKRYSTVLVRKDLNFGRMHINELRKTSGDADAKMWTVNTLLRTSSFRTNYQQNYGVDDEIDEMKERFLMSYAELADGELVNLSVNTNFQKGNYT